jgi:hypothetical protein
MPSNPDLDRYAVLVDLHSKRDITNNQLEEKHILYHKIASELNDTSCRPECGELHNYHEFKIKELEDKYRGHHDAYYHALELYYKEIDKVTELQENLEIVEIRNTVITKQLYRMLETLQNKTKQYDEAIIALKKRNSELKHVKRKLSKVPQLPKGWSNFKIVETQDGCYTGQINIDDHKLFIEYTDDWDNNGRHILAEYTKKFLELKVGHDITRLEHPSGKCGSCDSLYYCNCRVDRI